MDLEITQEGGFVGEAGLFGHGMERKIGILLHQLLRVADAVVVRSIPVAGYQNLAAVQFKGRYRGALLVQEGKMGEGMHKFLSTEQKMLYFL